MSTADTPFTQRPTRRSAVRAGEDPQIQKIGLSDLLDAISRGVADFNAVPTHYFFLAIIYPMVTFAIAALYGDLDLLPILFPLVAGYTLLGPLVATGMYEISRRREFGRYTAWTNAFLVFKHHAIGSIAILGVLLFVMYFVWLFTAQFIYVQHFGTEPPASYLSFVTQLFTTAEGLSMMFFGCIAGLAFAIVVLSLSVVSFPMILDLDIGVFRAIVLSVKAVAANPFILAIWGVIVAASLVIGAVPFFIGLGIVLPVLGHSTWHIYRKIIEP